MPERFDEMDFWESLAKHYALWGQLYAGSCKEYQDGIIK